jgi:dipeptidyl aminopeptidase/acylaminoacyl peptidase
MVTNLNAVVAENRKLSKQFLGWIALACLVTAACELLAASPTLAAQEARRRFTVADDIGFNKISPKILFSPDERFFIVQSDRGRLDLNRAESSLRVYSTPDINRFLSQTNTQQEPSPLWSIARSASNGEDGVINSVQWLDDSSGFTFLAKTESGNDQLFLANPHTNKLKALTGEDQSVKAFVFRSEKDFVYAVPSQTAKERAKEWRRSAAVVGTGQSLANLMAPEDENAIEVCELWAVVDGKRFRVIDASSKHPVSIHFFDGTESLALSPDGHSLVTIVTVPVVPLEWETLYAPPVPLFFRRVRAGRQDPDALYGITDVNEYVVIDLVKGSVKPLTNAPAGDNAGWFALPINADWSADGKSVVMADTFIPADKQPALATDNRPCVTVADLSTGKLACVERHHDESAEDYQEMWAPSNAHFVSGKADRIMIRYLSGSTRIYVRAADGSWNAEGPVREPVPENHVVNIQIKQDLNDPPVLIVTDKQGKISRTLWDPNPQLKDIQFGDVSVFKWKAKDGRDWIAGLYKPPDYVKGKRYPLVIQTYGWFNDHDFNPHGAFTTAYAAQELAAAEIMVLQVETCGERGVGLVRGVGEAACQIAGYEAAVQQLASDGFVDPDRVGIIGFSKTCYFVMEAITNSTLHLKAASITEGLNYGYLQYVMDGEGPIAQQAEDDLGARPFGSGLQQWLKRSPGFNMDKVETPLQVVALGFGSPARVLYMWEPYVTLRLLKKPVDFIVLTDGDHVLTNPAARMASQGGSVDWFRFWLKGEEDPDPAKAEQYARWRELRKLQQSDQGNQSNGQTN